jgi:hypothetical protein
MSFAGIQFQHKSEQTGKLLKEVYILRSLVLSVLMAILLGVAGMVYASLDDFDGPNLGAIWTERDPANKGEITFTGGNMVLDLAAGADMYIQGVDGGVMFLTDPPDMNDFSVEMKLNVATNNNNQSPACQVGIVFFNEGEWAYSAWGPYANIDIRVEDCIGGSYRWRDGTQVGVDTGDVAIDNDVWLKAVKIGDELEFFTKGNANDAWVSGGTDTRLGPNFTPGNYQVGIIAKSWGGSVNSVFEIDYFDIPELSTTAVAPVGKLATTWSIIKK